MSILALKWANLFVPGYAFAGRMPGQKSGASERLEKFLLQNVPYQPGTGIDGRIGG
jgi:hypothetical protein